MRSNPHPISNPLGCRVRSMGICKAELRLHEDYCRQVPATQPKVVAAATAQHGHTHRATICTLRHVLLIRPLCPLKLEDKLVRKVHKLRAQSGVGERVLVVNVVSHGGYLSTGRRTTTGAWCHLTVRQNMRSAGAIRRDASPRVQRRCAGQVHGGKPRCHLPSKCCSCACQREGEVRELTR
jgi:hypothetical protein